MPNGSRRQRRSWGRRCCRPAPRMRPSRCCARAWTPRSALERTCTTFAARGSWSGRSRVASAAAIGESSSDRPRPSSQPSTPPGEVLRRLGRRRRHRRRPAGPVGREAGARDDRVDRRRVLGTVVAGGGRRRLSSRRRRWPHSTTGKLAAARRADEWSHRYGLGLYAWRAQAALALPRGPCRFRDRRRPGQAVGRHVARLDHRR